MENKLQLPKVLLIWLAETAAVVLLMGPLFILIFGLSHEATLLLDVARVQLLTVAFVSLSGFWATTAILSAISRRHRTWLWLYPAISSLLWILHAQFFFAGFARPTDSAFRIQIAGACLVLTCASVGSWVLWGAISRGASET